MTDTLTHEERPSEIVGGEGHGLLTLPDGRSIPFKAHPLADLFPMMSAEEHAALVEDVKQRGVQRPIVLLDGQVLDGRNRYMAARDAEVGYRVVEFTGDDPLAFVISENMRRRHLTDSQRAMVAAKIAKLPHGGDRRSDQAADLPLGPTQAQAAETMNVGERSVRAAKSVIDHGAPELAQAVETGQVSVSAAAEVAKLPEAEQQEIVAQGPAAVKEAAKAARQPKPETAQKHKPQPKRPPNGLSGLTREGLEDEVIGLREETAELRKETKALKAERDELKKQVRDLSDSDSGKIIRTQAKEIENLKAARWRAEEAAAKSVVAEKAMQKKLRAAEARVAELQDTPIEMGV